MKLSLVLCDVVETRCHDGDKQHVHDLKGIFCVDIHP